MTKSFIRDKTNGWRYGIAALLSVSYFAAILLAVFGDSLSSMERVKLLWHEPLLLLLSVWNVRQLAWSLERITIRDAGIEFSSLGRKREVKWNAIAEAGVGPSYGFGSYGYVDSCIYVTVRSLTEKERCTALSPIAAFFPDKGYFLFPFPSKSAQENMISRLAQHCMGEENAELLLDSYNLSDSQKGWLAFWSREDGVQAVRKREFKRLARLGTVATTLSRMGWLFSHAWLLSWLLCRTFLNAPLSLADWFTHSWVLAPVCLLCILTQLPLILCQRLKWGT